MSKHKYIYYLKHRIPRIPIISNDFYKGNFFLSMRILNIVTFLVKLLLMEVFSSGKQNLNQLISGDEDIFRDLSFYEYS